MTAELLPKNFTKYAPLVLATGQVTGPNRRPICFAFRTEPNNDADSGWVFWSGEEDQAYLDNSSNTGLYPLLGFLELDPSLEAILRHPINTAWERDDVSDAWREVVGYFDE
jgi:hypothetical protein